MKRWSGKDFEYRGYTIKNNKTDGFLNVYDSRGNYIFRVDSFGKGCVNAVKYRIDDIIKRFGEN